MLFFFNKNTVELGLIAFIFATIGYGGSLVFYNSFLPVIAEHADQDKISARGYSLGYLGGVVLLLFNLVFVMFPDVFGITDDSFAPRLGLSFCISLVDRVFHRSPSTGCPNIPSAKG